MTFLRPAKHVRFWTFLVLLAYVAQAVGVSAHGKVAMMASSHIKSAEALMPQSNHAPMGHCHGEKSESGSVLSTGSQVSAQEEESCCDEGCSMSVCHPISVTLSNSVLFPYTFENLVIFFSHQSDVHQLATTLYRPPILG